MDQNINTIVESVSRKEAYILIEKLVAKLKILDSDKQRKTLDINSFSFSKSQEILKEYKDSFSNTVLEERKLR